MYVGRWWNDRMDCRQWGAHFPHVAGISGQSKRGAQSVVLSGGCAHPPPAPPAPLLPTDASGMVPCLSSRPRLPFRKTSALDSRSMLRRAYCVGSCCRYNGKETLDATPRTRAGMGHAIC